MFTDHEEIHGQHQPAQYPMQPEHLGIAIRYDLLYNQKVDIAIATALGPCL